MKIETENEVEQTFLNEYEDLKKLKVYELIEIIMRDIAKDKINSISSCLTMFYNDPEIHKKLHDLNEYLWLKYKNKDFKYNKKLKADFLVE